MLRIVDRYLLREFLLSLLLGLTTFVGIYLVVDLFERIDTFVDHKASPLTVATYYLYGLPVIIVQVLPVAMLLSSLFSVGLLAKHRELTAMKSAGLSLYRILWPIFSLACTGVGQV